ncbi:NotI family restriction endonuclease [Alcaligenes sp. GCM10023179]|uniref:NotI family restriction endonuclease n=1 Tax=Alcaligenes sp. GCM10023179 TaxID=3252633 RepID=UPI00361C1A35
MAQPLFEVFGFPYYSQSAEAIHHRARKLCPFQPEMVPCTKVSVSNPLGVCSVADGSSEAITCPTRFKEDWLIARNAAAFFFPPGAKYHILPEVRIKSGTGESAGNIDVVLAQVDSAGEVVDFGSIEIQAVYISGNVREPFEFYMRDPAANGAIGWTGTNSPRADYLSSSRKRLAPQMLMKGGILKSWGKKQAIVLHKGFFQTLPILEEIPETKKESADIVWLIYDLVQHPTEERFVLTLVKSIYTEFGSALATITTRQAGEIASFEAVLRSKLAKI